MAKRVIYREIQDVPIIEGNRNREATPFIKRVEQQHIRERELGAGKTQLALSSTTFSQSLSLGDDTRLTSMIRIRIADAKKIVPMNLLTDIYTIQKADGYLLNSGDHDFNLTGTQGSHEYYYHMGKFINDNEAPNSINVVAYFINRSGSTQDYFFEYSLVYISE